MTLWMMFLADEGGLGGRLIIDRSRRKTTAGAIGKPPATATGWLVGTLRRMRGSLQTVGLCIYHPRFQGKKLCGTCSDLEKVVNSLRCGESDPDPPGESE